MDSWFDNDWSKIRFYNCNKLRLLLENNMRGGPRLCMGNRCVKKGERKLVYEDMDQLYGWSVSRYLPTGDFYEVKVTRISLKTISRTPDDDEHGFFKGCDLEYPSSIHEKTNNFPFFPDKKTIKVEDFSPYIIKKNR